MKAMYLITSRGKPEIKSWAIITPAFQSFLDACLAPDPNRRKGAEELLVHAFLSKPASLKTIMPNIMAARKKKKGLI